MLKKLLDTVVPARKSKKILQMLQRTVDKNRASIHEKNFGRHMMIFGSTGTGKSRLLMTIVSQLKFRLKQRCIFIDIKLELARSLGVFPESQQAGEVCDIMFSPAFKNSVKWTLFNDIRTVHDILAVSYSMVPDDPKNPNSYWVLSARAVLQALLLFLKSTKEGATNAKLWEYVNDKEKLKALVSNKKIREHLFKTFKVDKEVYLSLANFIDFSGQGDRVGSTLGTLSSIISQFKMIKDLDGPFSFIDYVEDENETRSIFFGAPEHIKDDLMKLFRGPIEIMVKRILKMDVLDSRRFNLILDEFSGMGYMPTVIDAEGRGRAYGLRVLLAFQTLEDIKKNFGDAYKILVDNVNSMAVYKTTYSAKEAADLIGEVEYVGANESHSSGANSVRDGATVTRDFDKKKHAVSPGEIQSLQDGESYLSLAGSSSVLFGKLSYGEFPDRKNKFERVEEVIETDVYSLTNFEIEYEKMANDPLYRTPEDADVENELQVKASKMLDSQEKTGTEDFFGLVDVSDSVKEMNGKLDDMDDNVRSALMQAVDIDSKLKKPDLSYDHEADPKKEKEKYLKVKADMYFSEEDAVLDEAMKDIESEVDDIENGYLDSENNTEESADDMFDDFDDETA